MIDKYIRSLIIPILLLLHLNIFRITEAFHINIQKHNYKPSPLPSTTYEYDTYPSIFDTEIPSGIRGEAIRSSLRSKTRGIYYKPLELNSSMIHVTGKGTIQFLNNKFTSSFEPKQSSYESCILTIKGKVLDNVMVVVEDLENAYVITSPYSGDVLFQKLNDLIFPL